PVLKAVVKMLWVGPVMIGPGMRQIRATPSAPLVARVPLSRTKTVDVTGAGCGRVVMTLRVVVSQIHTLLSELAPARLWPSGLKVTALTQPRGPMSGCPVVLGPAG